MLHFYAILPSLDGLGNRKHLFCGHSRQELIRQLFAFLNMASLRRVADVTHELFVDEYLLRNRPVIVVDAMRQWQATTKWTPDFLSYQFGDLNTQVYDTLFKLVDVMPLREYIAVSFGKASVSATATYVRWYAKFKDFDFEWSDPVFAAIANDWAHPYFLPTLGYVMPFSRSRHVFANHDIFPYKGIFISAAGARTRLHKDPFGTDAVLCQFYGEKRLSLYPPTSKTAIERDGVFLDPSQPDTDRFPERREDVATVEDTLKPGEILFIPGGWYHDVETISDSVSITWNFVHDIKKDLFLREVADERNSFDRDMLKFFFGSPALPNPTSEDILRMVG